MAEKDGKTELPSAKRLRDARKRGEVPKTQELAAAVSLLVFSFLILSLWQFFAASFLPYFSQSLAQLADYQTSLADLPKLGVQSILLLLLLCAPVFLVALGVGLITNYAQVGLLFSGKAIKPDFKAEPHQRDQAAIQFALVDEFRQNIGEIRRDRLLVLSTIFSRRPCFTGFE